MFGTCQVGVSSFGGALLLEILWYAMQQANMAWTG